MPFARFFRYFLVFALAPLTSYVYWVGLQSVGIMSGKATGLPFGAALAPTFMTYVYYVPLAFVVVALYGRWQAKSLDTFPRLIVVGLVFGALIGLQFARGPGWEIMVMSGLIVGALIGTALALGTRWIQRLA